MDKTELSDVVKGVLKDAGLDALLERVEEMKTKQTDWFAEQEQRTAVSEDSLKNGEFVGRIIRAFAAGRGDCDKAASWARKEWQDETLAKALESGSETAGGFLVRDEYAAGIIELLYPNSVVRASGPMVVPLDSGTLRMPKITSGSSGTWIGENQNISTTQPVFGQIMLTARKYASLVPISNDLIRRGGPQVDRVVRDDLVRDIAKSTDLALIRSDGVGGEPKGLRYQGNTQAANGTVSLANVTTDIGTMLQTMGDNNVVMQRPGWLMEWRTWRYLVTVRDSNGNFAFKPEMDGGSLFGIPFRLTSQIPRNLGSGTNETELYLADFSDVVLGEATSILLDVSSTAAYHDGSAVQASFSLDQSVIRAIIELDLGVRYPEAVLVLTGVKWGV